MAGNRKKAVRKRVAAMIVAAFLVIILILGTIAPFFARAEALPAVGTAVEAELE